MADFTERTGQISLADLRENYAHGVLTKRSVDPDPVIQFGRWFKEAQAAQIKEPNAMTLATVTAAGLPSARIVLLKGFGDHGFVFYTNYRSRKGEELALNPAVALTFLWAELERQVRIEGIAEKICRADSENYFRSRPRGSRIGAWVSEQSQSVSSRNALESTLKTIEARFNGTDDIPLPDFWGGYRVVPSLFEFWQGRPNRLHDRIVYSKGVESWEIGRLWP